MKSTWENAEAGDIIGREKIKHTPVPWTRQGTRIQYQKNAGEYRFDIAEVFRDVGAKCAESNAEFICRAVNSHADLLEALRECITEDGAVAWRSAEFAGRRLEAISNIARTALKKAESAS